ncbi:MAG: AMP-binding protein [Bacteroidales bacterium]|nr:AMP-binding protein [Bacteroidales bacterium]MCF8386775.1 AMP-binding protein [Bacteroidales bacterium]MCF8398222.1 AMP-binding protein [Bacteroidales bacterium]
MDLLNFLDDKITEEDTYTYSLTDVLKIRAEKEPQKTAYIFLKDGEDEEERITYGELYQSALTIAGKIRKNSKEGERALMLYPPGLEFVKALFGSFFANIIAVPVYPPRKNRSLNRIMSIVDDSEASLVLTTDYIHSSFHKNFSDIQSLKELYWIVTEGINAGPKFSGEIFNEDIALLQYTSGSTGTPKGVMVTHKNIMRGSEYIRQCFMHSRKSTSVSWLPDFHDMGLFDGVLQPMYTGYLGVLFPPVAFSQKPTRWLNAMTKYKATHSSAPNFAFDLCVEKIDEKESMELNLSSMDSLLNGAEPVRKETLDEFAKHFEKTGFRENVLYPGYGMAETTLMISGGFVNEKPVYLKLVKKEFEKNLIVLARNNKSETCFQVGVGHPWIDTVVRIVDPDTKQECNENEVGEIWVSGSVVTKGYWNREKETKETFHAYIADKGEGPFLRTGDLGFLRDGELFVTGRLKDLIIIHGRNIYPQDIELLAETSHEGIRANCSAAFSMDENGSENLHIAAEVERMYVRNPDVEGISDAVRQAVYDEFDLEVKGVILLRTASIPKTSSGKIQRKATKKAYLENKLNIVGVSILGSETGKEDSDVEVSLSSVQSWLIAWLSINLKIGIEKINPKRPIVAYGLNSIKAVVLRNDFLKTYGVDFPPYLFFEKMTIEDMAEKAMELIEEKGNIQ